MKDKILFGLFVLLAFSAGFTLGGVGKSATDAPTAPEVLEPFLADYRQRYEILDIERSKLQAELDAAKQELADIQSSGDTISVLKAQVLQQQAELGKLSVSLQNATADSASWQQKFQQSQYAINELQKSVVAAQRDYSGLYSKLSVINSRESDTVNGFTADEKAVFYRVWDEWWELVVEGID